MREAGELSNDVLCHGARILNWDNNASEHLINAPCIQGTNTRSKLPNNFIRAPTDIVGAKNIEN